ncbi:MAG: hypothetical protein NWR72_06185 [Bacteroidia bacterium]|nr:hypothetical protein [Bacteroidia bacterium]
MNKLVLSFPRLALVLRNDLRIFVRPILLASAVLLGLMLILYMVQVQDVLEHGTIPPFFTEWFGVVLFLSGFLFSSLAFFELSHKGKAMAFLLTPASQLEKWLSRWLLTSLGFTFYLWLVFGVISLICGGVSQLVFGAQLSPFEWGGENVWLLLRLYLVFQSLFMAGSVFFGKLAFLKTPISLAIVGVALLLVLYVTIKLVMWDISKPGWSFEPDGAFQNSAAYKDFMEYYAVGALSFLFWWGMAPFFWVVSYVRLTEKEV